MTETVFSEPGAGHLRAHAGEYLRSPGSTLAKGFHHLRARWALRSATAVGPLVRAYGHVHVLNRGELRVGARVRLFGMHYPTLLSVFDDGRLVIGDGTFVNYGADIAATTSVTIGRDCLIGTHCVVLDNDFHDLHDRELRPTGRPVVIEDGVWLGNRVVVLPGVTIGAGAVVGAGSVVTKDVPPKSVVAGNPARVIRGLS
jgi:maltose O-acetyltransferase